MLHLMFRKRNERLRRETHNDGEPDAMMSPQEIAARQKAFTPKQVKAKKTASNQV